MSVAELRPAAAPGAIPTAEELVARARALAPKLRERAVRAERDRNIPQASVDEFIDAGLIHTLQPKRWGGYEHDHEVAFDIAVELGKSTCGSSAWCLNYLADHACILALFPEEAQHDVWSRDKAACIATSAAPTGKVAPAPGGYRLDGRWSWCSGLRHSQWIMIGGLVQRDGEDHPDMRLYLVPVSGGEAGRHLVLRRPARERLEHLGARQRLRARASQRVVLDAARRLLAGIEGQHQSDLPHAVHRGAQLCAARPGARPRARRLCRLRAVDAQALPDLHRSSTSPSTCRCRCASPRSPPQIDAAELLARRAFKLARQDYSGMSLETRTLLRRDFTYAVRKLREAMDDLVKISGSSGLMDDNPIQRCWRDVHAISSHVVMNWDVPAENFGRMEFGLGLNPAYPMF